MTPAEMHADYNWRNAFAEAARAISRCANYSGSVRPFVVDDVVQVLAAVAGENEEASWIAIVKLDDGRLAYIEAGCDYTGWDCQASGQASVGKNLSNVVRFGCTDESRRRFASDPSTSKTVLRAIRQVMESVADR